MAFDTMSDTTFICPQCKLTARIRVRIDDWNHVEIDGLDEKTVSVCGHINPSATCKLCNVDMEILEHHDTPVYYQTTNDQ